MEQQNERIPVDRQKMNERNLRGPAYIRKTTNEMIRFFHPDIIEATLFVNGNHYDLLQNTITIRPLSDGRHMFHHSFTFLHNQEQFGGHWYDTTMDVRAIQDLIQENTLTYIHTQMQDLEQQRHHATYTVTLSEKGRKKIMDLV